MSAPNFKGRSGPGQLCPRAAQCHQQCTPAAQVTYKTQGGVLAGGIGQKSVLLPCPHRCWQEVGMATSSEKLHLDPRGWRELFALPRGQILSQKWMQCFWFYFSVCTYKQFRTARYTWRTQFRIKKEPHWFHLTETERFVEETTDSAYFFCYR